MTSQKAKRVVIVLSAGRSGTSLLMRVLGCMGMKLSENMLPGSAGNPEGLYEDADIVDVHKKIFKDLNSHPTIPMPPGWMEAETVNKAKSQLEKILEDRLTGNSAIWGFKDPRTATLLPLWNRILNVPGTVPVFILAVRDPSTVANSLRRQIDRAEAVTELQWLQRTTEAIYHTAADCFIVHYEDWFKRPIEMAHELLLYTGLNNYYTCDIDVAIKEVIKPNLNRAVYEDYQAKNEYVRKLYDVLKECRGSDFDRATLMPVVKECCKAMEGFKGWYQEAQKYISQNQSLREKLRGKDDKIEKLKKSQENNEVLKNKIEKLEGQVQSYKEELESSRERNRELEGQVNSYREELESSRERNRELEGQVNSYREELEKSAKSIEEQQSDLESLRHKLKQRQSELDQLQAEFTDLEIRHKKLLSFNMRMIKLLRLEECAPADSQKKYKKIKKAIPFNQLVNEFKKFTQTGELKDMQPEQMVLKNNKNQKKLNTLANQLYTDITALLTSKSLRIKLWRLTNYLILFLTLGMRNPKKKSSMRRLQLLAQEWRQKNLNRNRVPEQNLKWMAQAEKAFHALMRSPRWRAGDKAVRMSQQLLMKGAQPWKTDRIQETLKEFEDFRAEMIESTEGKPISGQTRAEKRTKKTAGAQKKNKPPAKNTKAQTAINERSNLIDQELTEANKESERLRQRLEKYNSDIRKMDEEYSQLNGGEERAEQLGLQLEEYVLAANKALTELKDTEEKINELRIRKFSAN